MEELIKSDSYKKLRLMILVPFLLESQGKFSEAIKDHEAAVKVLNESLAGFKKKIGKFYRVMFERQAEVHLERIKYLKALEAKGNWEGVVVTPTVLSAEKVLEVSEGEKGSLSSENKELFTHNSEYKNPDSKIEESIPTSIAHLLQPTIPYYTPTLPSNQPPTIYRITHDSELLQLGERAHWFFVKDPTNTHMLYAMHAVWSLSAPITHCLLRRASEFLPGAGCVQVSLQRQKGGCFKMTMTNPSGVKVEEMPDLPEIRKNWGPRRFEYGGRSFVWKDEKENGSGGGAERGLMNMFGFQWESLYEYKKGSVKAKEGSLTGKTEDEVVGERLFWGEKGDGGVGKKDMTKKADYTLFVKGGIDQVFREHLLASALARMTRWKYPPNEDSGRAEKIAAGAGAGAGLFGFVAAVAGS